MPDKVLKMNKRAGNSTATYTHNSSGTPTFYLPFPQ